MGILFPFVVTGEKVPPPPQHTHSFKVVPRSSDIKQLTMLNFNDRKDHFLLSKLPYFQPRSSNSLGI